MKKKIATNKKGGTKCAVCKQKMLNPNRTVCSSKCFYLDKRSYYVFNKKTKKTEKKYTVPI